MMIDRPTVCGFCSCGCAIYVEPRNGRVGAFCPSANHPVSTGRLCIKGWNATPSIRGADRLRTPLVKKGDGLQPATWDEAISFTASALKRVSSASGPKSIGVIGSSKTTNEECYLLAKFARGVVGTPNIDGSSRLYDASLVPGLLDTIGTAASQVELNALRDAGSMLIVGANVTEQLAHIGSRIEDAKENGCKVVATDPRRTRLAAYTSLFLQPRPGTDLVWLRALIKAILQMKLFVDDAVELPGFEELRGSVDDVSAAVLPAECGLEAHRVEEAAEMLAWNAPVVVMFGLGVLQQDESTEIVKALADVALLLGGSVVPLRGQNNAQGASDMGLAHDYLPGYAPISDPEARRKWGEVWGSEIPAGPGMGAADMIRGCASGEIKALLIFGENLALSAPNTEESLAALDKAEFLAVADLYLTQTARLADVVFPACSFLEKDGTFTSIERRVQRVRKVFEPVGESKSDLEVTADLALAMGKNIERDPANVMAEIAANVAPYSGVSYEALDERWGTPWPMNGARRRLAALSAPKAAEPDEEYPFRLVASRIHFHQQTGTLAARSTVLAREYPETFVEMNENDAERRGLRQGSRVRVSSRSGSMTRMLMLSDTLPPGCIHAPHFFGGDSPNALTGYQSDRVSGAPVYKGLSVKVEAVK